MPKADIEYFIKKSRYVHGDKYSYDKAVYVNNRTKLTITCPLHGDFEQTPDNHYRGKGCPVCGNISRSENHKDTREEFIRKANIRHNNFYSYDKVAYVNAHTKVTITCPIHGDFEQFAGKHVGGCGCPKCARERTIKASKYTQEDFIEAARNVHGNYYDYSKVKYVTSQKKVIITCPKHGDFEQNPDSHIQGHGCPVCGTLVSDKEQEICDFLTDHGFVVDHGNRELLEGKEIDLYLPDQKFAIEYNGLYWHSEANGKNVHYHLDKLNSCLNKGVRLVQIFEDEYKLNKDLVLDKLLTLLHSNQNKEKCGGRNCIVGEIKKKDAELFLNKNHIQGFDPSSVYVGCFRKSDNILVGVMSFLKDRKNSSDWELTRFATEISLSCPGVAGKCLKYFITKYKPSKIKSFADRRWTVDQNDNLYTKLGFVLESVEKPNYCYAFRGKRFHKFGFRKQVLHRKYGYPLTMTEREMCDDLKAYRIWNCGLLKYTLSL